MNPEANEGALGESLGKKLFRSRVELITELDRTGQGGTPLRTETAELLRGEVAAMNVDNFIVRPQRQLVERFADAGAWAQLTTEAVSELLGGVAGLPSAATDQDQDAKQFDLLILRRQLTLLRGEPGFETLKGQVMGIASLLEEKAAIPMVAAQLALLQEIQSDSFWEGTVRVFPAPVAITSRALRWWCSSNAAAIRRMARSW